jgi:hypothetical protein
MNYGDGVMYSFEVLHVDLAVVDASVCAGPRCELKRLLHRLTPRSVGDPHILSASRTGSAHVNSFDIFVPTFGSSAGDVRAAVAESSLGGALKRRLWREEPSCITSAYVRKALYHFRASLM